MKRQNCLLLINIIYQLLQEESWYFQRGCGVGIEEIIYKMYSL